VRRSNIGIEARISVSGGDDLRRAGAEDRPRNAGGIRNPDLDDPLAAHHPREQLSGVGVVQEERRPLRFESVGDQLDQPRQLMVERQLLRHQIGDLGENRKTTHPVDEARSRAGVVALQRRRKRRRLDGTERVAKDLVQDVPVRAHHHSCCRHPVKRRYTGGLAG